jgi:dTMP kinase
LIGIHSVVQRNGSGRFITLEGGEGTGKSTQIRHLVERLLGHGIHAIKTREPGGSEGAERIRSVILAAGQTRFGALTETLLFFAARNDHLEQVIRPELLKGNWVICDRFSDSTCVYQGCMGTIGKETLDALEALVIAETAPDLTLILDLPAEIGLARAVARRGDSAADGFEAENIEFHQGLRQCYLALANLYPERCLMIDALGSEEEVAERIWAVLSDRFADLMRNPSHG